MSAAPPTDSRVLAEAGASLLRTATRDQHAQAEDATGLPGSLRSSADVAGLLLRWHRLAALLEPRAGGIVPTLLPKLEADLAGLGHAPRRIPVEEASPRAADASVLGVAWVLLGARLGLRSIADDVELLVGRPVESCTATEPALLRDVRARVDRLAPDDVHLAVMAARGAFDTAITELGGPPWST